MENVENIYPLSPMQQGMLFHSLFEPSAGLYIELLSARLTGPLDVPLFKQTWQRTIDRHPILRTAFVAENVKEPVQVVYKQVQLPFDEQDLRLLSREEQHSHLERYTHEQRMRGFVMTKPPLLRVAVFRTGDEEYQLVVSHHHILLDGWSIPLLMRDILFTYNSLVNGIDPQLPESRPYRDYIVWLKRQDLSVSEGFWRKKLAGFSAPTPLSVTRLDLRSLAAEPEFEEIEVQLGERASTDLVKMARQQRVTLNTLVQGAWSLLLSRYSGEEDIVFGVTVSGRPVDLSGSENMIGLFINTLPFRVRVDREAQLGEWLSHLQNEQVEIRHYEYTPLVQIQGWSQVPRGTPLFDSLLVFENIPTGSLQSGARSSVNLEGGSSVSYTNFPLTVVAVPGEEMLIKISYDAQLFDRATIQRMVSHLSTILEAMPAYVSRRLVDIPMLSVAEQRQLLEEWNIPHSSYRSDRCIHHWVEEQVEKTPLAIAVTFEDVHLTYQQLNQRANHLAHYLKSLGVGPESLVGIYLERNINVVIAILGILKAGGAYVPLDPAYPASRLAFIVEDYSLAQQSLGTSEQPSVLITQSSMLANLVQTSAQLVCIDTDWAEIVQKTGGETDPGNLDSGVQPENLAYVIYTSGSTGKPKGCMITHANVVRLFYATEDWYGFGASDVWTLFHSYAFDFSVWEIWGALFYGGRLVVVPYLVSRSTDAFYELLCQEGVTVLNQTPSAFRQLIRAEEAAGVNPALALRFVIFGGEALELQSLKPWFERHGDRMPQLVNMYGITETTVHVTYRPIYVRDLDMAPGSVIGEAIPDLQVYILDQSFQPVPIGVPGELFVGGAGVARGYLNRLELTEQRFVPGMFGRTSDQRVYRSGDLARYLPDGDIEYLGRIDHQVKIRGFRVELGEIESVIVQFPGVHEAVVLAREDGGHKRLVAYLVAKNGSVNLQAIELRKHVSEKLPDYMVPASFILMDTFPLTTNGKIDRAVLLAMPVPDQARMVIEKPFDPPQSAEEKSMAALWAQLLGVERVGLGDQFFELGGDSILSIQLVSRAKQAGFQISYRMLFEHPVLKDLMAALRKMETGTEQDELVSGRVNLTPVQRWFFELHSDAPAHFNTSIFLKVGSGIDPEIIQKALEHLLSHHDQLRAKFEYSAGEWKQSVEAACPLPFRVVDLSSLPTADQPAALEAQAAAIQAELRLDQPPLLRVVYFKLGDQSSARLLFVFHHLVTDGVSMRIFMEDFQTTYLYLMGGGEVKLPAKTLSYQAWANRLQEYADSTEIRDELSYWAEIPDKNLTALSVDHPEGFNLYGTTEDVTVSLSAEETALMLHHLPAYYNCRVVDALLLALVKTFTTQGDQSGMLIELEGHGREEIPGTALEGADLSRSMGWFTSIFPVYFEHPAGNENRKLLHELSRHVHQVPNRGIGYGLLRYLCTDQAVRETLAGKPQPEINFNYLGQFDQTGVEIPGGAEPATSDDQLMEDRQRGTDAGLDYTLELAPEFAGAEQNPESQRSSKLYVVAIVNGGQLSLRWLYSRGLHDRATIEDWAARYLDHLRELLKELR